MSHTGEILIKVCGMRDADNIRDLEELRPDMMGFIFYPRSPRYVSRMPAYMPRHTACVGVFVNADAQCVADTARAYGLDYVQLHGHESPQMCAQLSEQGLSVIKAFQIATEADIDLTGPYEGSCRMYLFDTACSGYGGSGQMFDWQLLQRYRGATPFLLSGGIGAGSVEAVRAFSHPMMAGIDINSRFETSPAVKDIPLIKEFITKLKDPT